MRRTTLLVTLLISLPAAASAVDVQPSPTWVAIGHGVWVSTPDGQQARLLTHRDGSMPMRAVWLGEQDGVVRIGVPLPSDKVHCLNAGPVDGVWQVQLLVSADDLVPVTVRPVDLTFDDGTKLQFKAGAPVADDGTVRSRSFVAGQRVPAEAIGTRWHAIGEERRPFGHDRWVRADVPLLVDGLPIGVGGGHGVSSSGATGLTGEVGRRSLVALHNRCASAVAKVRYEQLTDRDGIFGGMMPSSGEGDQVEFAVGAELSWPDGASAGRLTEARRFYTSYTRRIGDRICGRISVGVSDGGDAPPPPETSFEICTRSL